MKIVDKRPIVRQVKFGDLKDGEFFEYDGDVFVKHHTIKNNPQYTPTGNAVWIKHGLDILFNDDTIVTPLKCYLVIESEESAEE